MKLLVSGDLNRKIHVKKWFVLLFQNLTVGSHCNLNINDLHNSAAPLGPEQSPTNHTCYGIYFPAYLRCYRPLKLTQLGSSFGLASV